MPMQNEILYQLEDNPEFIGVSAEETTLKYTSYVKRVSDSKNLAIIVSAMLRVLGHITKFQPITITTYRTFII